MRPCWAALAAVCVVAAVGGAAAQAVSGQDLQGDRVQGTILVTGVKNPNGWDDARVKTEIKLWMNAQLFNINCGDTLNNYFPQNTRTTAAQDTCLQGDGVDVLNMGALTETDQWYFQYKVNVVGQGAGSKLQQPTMCLSVNDVNRLRTWGAARMSWSDVAFGCTLRTNAAGAKPCACTNPTMTPGGKAADDGGWKTSALAGLSLMGVLALGWFITLVVCCTRYSPRSKAAKDDSEPQSEEAEVGYKMFYPAILGPEPKLKL